MNPPPPQKKNLLVLNMAVFVPEYYRICPRYDRICPQCEWVFFSRS